MEAQGPNVITAEHISVSDMGSTRVLNCKFGDDIIRAKILRDQPVPKLGRINLLLPSEKLLAYQDGRIV